MKLNKSMIVLVVVIWLAACSPAVTLEPDVVTPEPDVVTPEPVAVTPEPDAATTYGLLVVEAVAVEVLAGGPAPSISIAVSPTWPDDCMLWEKREGAIQQHQAGQTFYIEVYITYLTNAECDANMQPLVLGIGLDYTDLPAGDYTVDVNGVTANFSIDSAQAFDQNDRDQIQAVVSAVHADLAARFGVSAADILSVQPMQWPDSCLGLAGPDELCSAVIVEGYLVVAGDGTQTWEYHSNQDGTVLRVAIP